jgi:hypothetical protein
VRRSIVGLSVDRVPESSACSRAVRFPSCATSLDCTSPQLEAPLQLQASPLPVQLISCKNGYVWSQEGAVCKGGGHLHPSWCSNPATPRSSRSQVCSLPPVPGFCWNHALQLISSRSCSLASRGGVAAATYDALTCRTAPAGLWSPCPCPAVLLRPCLPHRVHCRPPADWFRPSARDALPLPSASGMLFVTIALVCLQVLGWLIMPRQAACPAVPLSGQHDAVPRCCYARYLLRCLGITPPCTSFSTHCR